MPYVRWDRKIGGYKIVKKDDIDILFEKGRRKVMKTKENNISGEIILKVKVRYTGISQAPVKKMFSRIRNLILSHFKDWTGVGAVGCGSINNYNLGYEYKVKSVSIEKE